MSRQFTATGATVEEAIENACRDLGVSGEDVTPEILRFPKKGFLGLGKVTAEVRVTVAGEEEPKKPVRKPSPAPRKQPEQQLEKQPEPVQKPKPAAQEVPQKPDKPAKPDPVAPAAPQAEEKTAPAPAPEAAAAPAEQPAESLPPELLQPKMDIAREYLTAIFEKMGITGIELRMEPAENRTVLIHLDGGDIGTVIGKRGETLDAVQYLVSLAANRSEGDYVRFTINAGNYREKREETLRALAQRMARKVLKTGRPVALEPMNPYERRIIHAVVTDIEGVYSKSTGEEPNRKVVIKPSGKSSASGRAAAARRDSAPRRSGRGGRPSRPPRSGDPRERFPAAEEDGQQEAPAERPAPKTEKVVLDDDVKLYTKIEL